MNKLKQIFPAKPSASSVRGPLIADGIASTSGEAGVPKRLHAHRVDKGGSGGQNENALMYV
jgi:hypothetical protein